LDQCHDCGVRRKQVANPTTNYGFVLPTPTDLVTDLPADFDVALQGVDTRLKALQPGTTLGDLAYSSATANTNTRLAIGTSGQILAVSGGGVPEWTTPAAAASGLTLVTRQSFSGVADTSTTFDDCFTSTYKSYLVCFEEIYSSTNDTFLYFQYRYAGPTTQAGAYYGSITNYTHTGATNNTAQSGTAQISVCKIGSAGSATNGNIVTLNVNAVGNSSQKPAITGLSAGNATTGAFLLGCTQDTARTYTGFILSAAAGNITGTVAVYGLAAA
jgi:hypothetical protein